MSNAGIKKRDRSSTQRRHEAADRIKAIGIQLLGMGRCTSCQNSNSLCFVVAGRNRCSSCEKKNSQKCDGKFSTTEFDFIEKEKQKLKQQAADQRAEVGRLAMAAAAAYAALSAAQQRESELDRRVDKYVETQSRMLRQELEALDALEEGSNPSDHVALMSDDGMFWSEGLTELPSWESAMREAGGGSPQVSG
jgi:hypothetical protein